MEYGNHESQRIDHLKASSADLERAPDAVATASAVAQSAEILAQVTALANEEVGGLGPPLQMSPQSPAALQASEIRAAADPHEREAEQVAKRVVNGLDGRSGPESRAAPREVAGPRLAMTGPDIQRVAADAGGMVDADDCGTIQQARGGGQPLAEDVREPMERSFGADFSGVRVHTDARADQLNRSFQARAFTTGKDMFFKQGEYAPGSSSGRELIAHELTHVVQQSGKPAIQFKLIPEAKEAFKTAKGKGGGKPYEDAELYTDKIPIPTSEQSSLVKLEGILARLFPSKKSLKTLKDLVRAFVLKGYAFKIEAIAGGDLPEKKKRSKYFKIAKRVRDMYAGLLKLGVAAPETQSFLRTEFPAAVGTLATKEEKEKELAKGPRIDVRSTYTSKKAPLRNHLFIVYTGSDGKQLYFRGFTQGGYATTAIGEYRMGGADWEPSAPSVTVLRGDAAKQKLDALITQTKNINAMKVPYVGVTWKFPPGLTGENCNCMAWTILTRAGIPTKKPAGIHPGWGHILGTHVSKVEGVEPQEEDNTNPGVPKQIKGNIKGGAATVYLDRMGTEEAGKLPACTPVEVLGTVGYLKRIKYGANMDKIGFVRGFGVLQNKDARGRPFKIDEEDWVATELYLEDLDAVHHTIYGAHNVEVLDPAFSGPKGENDLRLIRVKNLFMALKERIKEPVLRVEANRLKPR